MGGVFVLAAVEVDERMLVMLAAGTESHVEVPRGNRARINDAVLRALWRLAKCYSTAHMMSAHSRSGMRCSRRVTSRDGGSPRPGRDSRSTC